MTLMYEQILSEAPRVEKLKLWLRLQHPPMNFDKLARPLDLTGSALRRNCAGETMPVYQHEYLTRIGIPVELLPIPKDRKTGRKPKSHPAEAAPPETAQAV